MPDAASPEAARSGVLITRPEPGCSETARRVEAMGFMPVLAPMLLIRPRRARLPDAENIAAVVVASAAAIPGLPPSMLRKKIFAVGDATAEAARRAGFSAVASAGADAAALASLIADREDGAGPPLLLVTATGQGGALAVDLRARGFRVFRRAVYSAVPARALPPDALTSLDRGEVAMTLVFSAATGRALVDALGRARRVAMVSGIDALAISAAAAAALAPLPWRRIRVASHPNQEELLALLT